VSPLTVTDGEHKAHIFPTVSRAASLSLAPVDFGPLIYHGGQVMTGLGAGNRFYVIYWVPAHLQNGGATSMSAHYQLVQTLLAHDYSGHAIGNNNTQYYQTINGVRTYIYNRFDGDITYIDTNPYPASGCSDAATPGNCITDSQIQTEITRVMQLRGWTGGINNIVLLYTSSGEGSCFDSTNTSCAYTDYCAYHSFIAGNTPIIYANEPYGDVNNCQAQGTPSPTNDPAADAAATSASHEITEAITDPELDAWYTAQQNEIGDLCAYQYGTNTWNNGTANQSWFGHYYELQMEYDNHVQGCVQVGP
jgi:hypothetical protein